MRVILFVKPSKRPHRRAATHVNARRAVFEDPVLDWRRSSRHRESVREGTEAAELGKTAFDKVVELATDDVPKLVTSPPVKWVFAAGAGAGVPTAITAATGPAAPLAIVFAAAIAHEGASDLVRKAFVKIDPWVLGCRGRRGHPSDSR